jgi:NAD(P)-dependent dehydrogenase (short-subunit alcohol dehydrogenase family)
VRDRSQGDYLKADVSQREDVYAAVDHAENELGGFDIVVDNAGIAWIQPPRRGYACGAVCLSMTVFAFIDTGRSIYQ